MFKEVLAGWFYVLSVSNEGMIAFVQYDKNINLFVDKGAKVVEGSWAKIEVHADCMMDPDYNDRGLLINYKLCFARSYTPLSCGNTKFYLNGVEYCN